MQYRSEVDGLRAFAVLPVILFHARVPGLSGGFIGVDVFFVISGFLITSLLADDLAAGRYSLIRFYERRARRILPALFVVLAASIPLAFILMLPSQLEDFFASVGAVVLFLSNLFFISQVGYFSPDAELQPLLHTWSLAVEEQFYLLFPPLLALMWRRGVRFAAAVLVGVALLSLFLSFWGATENPARNFYFTGSRAWELMVGALAALFARSRSGAGNDVLAFLGLGLVMGAFLLWPPGLPAPGPWMLLPVAGTAMILVYAQAGTLAARFLSWRGFVALGLVSYSAYLWHQPLFAFARLANVGEPSPLVMTALIILTFLLAAATWAFVEQPFRRRPLPVWPQRASLFGRAALIGGTMLAIGILGKATDGFRSAWMVAWPERAAILAHVDRARTEAAAQDDGHCRFNIDAIDDALATRILDCERRHGSGIAVLGDSHAIDLFNIVVARNDRPFVVGITKLSCRPATTDRDCPYPSFEAFITRHPAVFQAVLFEMSGAYLLAGDDGLAGVQTAIERLPLDAVAPVLYPVDAEIELVNAALIRIGKITPIIWVGPKTEPQVQLDWLVSRGCDAGLGIREGTEASYATLDHVLEQRSQVPYLSQNRLFDLRFPRDLGGCDGLLWSDGDHLSLIGEQEMARRADVVGTALRLVGASALP
ncbi:MAG: acyltransferase [Tabrizicola sp.]|nr:acyltransferase [Tabrizicola sp.]